MLVQREGWRPGGANRSPCWNPVHHITNSNSHLFACTEIGFQTFKLGNKNGGRKMCSTVGGGPSTHPYLLLRMFSCKIWWKFPFGICGFCQSFNKLFKNTVWEVKNFTVKVQKNSVCILHNCELFSATQATCWSLNTPEAKSAGQMTKLFCLIMDLINPGFLPLFSLLPKLQQIHFSKHIVFLNPWQITEKSSITSNSVGQHIFHPWLVKQVSQVSYFFTL